MDISILVKRITLHLKRHGFERKGKSWYLRSQDTVALFNLQKSHYGDKYYGNLGIFFRLESTEEYPKEYQCHVRGRLECLGCDQKQVDDALSFEHGPPTEQQVNIVVDILERCVVPFLASAGTIESLKIKSASNELRGFLLHRTALLLLEPGIV